MKTLVLAIGNLLLSDEGIGIHVLHALEEQLRGDEEVELLDGGTLSFTLAGPIEDCDALIVIDAANLQREPGAWQRFEGEAFDRFLASNRRASVHEVGLTDLRAIALLTGGWPERRAMLGIQPAKLDWGEQPTEAVAAAIPPVCAAVLDQIGSWRHAA